MRQAAARRSLALGVVLLAVLIVGCAAEDPVPHKKHKKHTPLPLQTPVIESFSSSSSVGPQSTSPVVDSASWSSSSSSSFDSSNSASDSSSSSSDSSSSSSSSSSKRAHPYNKEFVAAQIARGKEQASSMKAAPEVQKLAAAMSVDAKGSIAYAARDAMCHEKGGLCKLTKDCYGLGGRTIQEAKPLCGGPVDRQCCFPSLYHADVHHVGPLDTMKEHHKIDKGGAPPTSNGHYNRLRMHATGAEDDKCAKHGGKCMDTAKCYKSGGRTVTEAANFCEGDHTKQCCFRSHKNKHMTGPLETLNELKGSKL